MWKKVDTKLAEVGKKWEELGTKQEEVGTKWAVVDTKRAEAYRKREHESNWSFKTCKCSL